MNWTGAPSKRTTLLLLITFCVCAGFLIAALLSRPRRLSYHDEFLQHNASEWTAYGGAWQLQHGVMLNRSDERGAKLITGSSAWTNYEVSTDVKLIGHGGDVGVLVRVRKPDEGTDAYNGYYVGLRSAESAVVIGRANYGWLESRPVAIQGGLEHGKWYNLRVVVVGCDIGAEVTNLASGERTWAAFHESSCVASGKIGLRSMGTGGAWRNISVQKASIADWLAIRSHAEFVGTPVFPVQEADYDAMRWHYFSSHKIRPKGDLSAATPPPSPAPMREVPPAIQSIASIRSMTSEATPVTLRAVVTLIDPLYVQDATGGINVRTQQPVALNLGDEVEIRGIPVIGSFVPRIDASNIRLRWDRTLILPTAVDSTQAATGAFNAALVQVSGILRSKSINPDGEISLALYDSAQRFQAVVRGGISQKQYAEWPVGGRLRLTGICLVTPALSSQGAAFTILLRSMEDVDVVAGPPWWSGRQLHRIIMIALILIVLGILLLFRLQRAKMEAILDERERLAHDMHDTLAQSFAGVGFHLQGLRNCLRSGTIDAATALERLNTACDLVTHTHREASATIAALHPGEDGGRNILVALERCVRSMLDTEDVPVAFVEDGSVRPMSLPVRDALFQIGREGITNALRHSGATRILVRIHYEARSITLTVEDNGHGVGMAPQQAGFGMRSMGRRASEVGAALSIQANLPQGTILSLKVPYGTRFELIEWSRSMLVRGMRLFWGLLPTRYLARSSAEKF